MVFNAIMKGNLMNRLTIKRGLLSAGVMLAALLSLSACGEPLTTETVQKDYQITLDCGNYNDVGFNVHYDDKATQCINIDNKNTGVYVLDAADNNTGGDMKIKVIVKDSNGSTSVFKKSNDNTSDWVLMNRK
jgi:hypothetical protein